MIVLTTTMGKICIELDFENAPISAQNFLQYAREEFYIGTVFHRVIDGFMIQGGGLDNDLIEKPPRDPIINEANNGRSNTIGTIAMARTSDPDSASSQFFINVADNDFLNHTDKTQQGWGYAVFADVVEGMEVVNHIKSVVTGSQRHHRDVPSELIEITEIHISDAYDQY